MTKEERYLERADRLGYREGRVTFDECQLCGCIFWKMTEPKEARSVVIVPMQYFCDGCHSARMRNPELVQWVINVLEKHVSDTEGE